MTERVRHVIFSAGDWLSAFVGLKVGSFVKGVYIDVIALCYDRGEPTLPLDATIERIAEMNRDNPRTVRAAFERLIEIGKMTRIDGPNGVEVEPKRVRMELERALNRMRTNREAGANGGRKSGEARREKRKNNDLGEANASDETKLTKPSNITKHEVEPEMAAPRADQLQARQFEDRILEAAKIDPARWPGNFGMIPTWRNQGATDADILAGIEAVAARKSYRPPSSLAYFTNAIGEARRLRVEAEASGRDPPQTAAAGASLLISQRAKYTAALLAAQAQGIEHGQAGYPRSADYGLVFDIRSGGSVLIDGWRPKPSEGSAA